MKYQNSRHMKQFNKRVLNSKILGIYLYLVAEIVKNPPEMWRPGFDPWVAKIPCRRAWQPLGYSCLENCHGQRSLAGCSPWGCKESDMTE